MKAINLGIFLAAALTLLSGCTVTMPSDPDFQREWKESWKESWEEAFEDLEDLENLENVGDAKTHQWKILDAQGEELYHFTEEEAVQEVDALFSADSRWRDCDLESWGPRTEEAGTPLYTYVFLQEKTLLAGQDPETPRDYEEILRFTVAEDRDTVTMQVLREFSDVALLPQAELVLEDLLTFHVSVPAETAEALRDPARFAS